jgi:hypothetical protein
MTRAEASVGAPAQLQSSAMTKKANQFLHEILIRFRPVSSFLIRKNPEAKLKLTYRLVMVFSLTLVAGLVVFGNGRSEAYYRAGAAGCGPRGCAAVGTAGTSRDGYGYRAGGVVVHRN